jgi:hypothetical protein
LPALTSSMIEEAKNCISLAVDGLRCSRLVGELIV